VPIDHLDSTAVENAVFVVIVLVVVAFAFLLGSLGSGRPRSDTGRLADELEVERRRVGELQQEVDRLRELAR